MFVVWGEQSKPAKVESWPRLRIVFLMLAGLKNFSAIASRFVNAHWTCNMTRTDFISLQKTPGSRIFGAGGGNRTHGLGIMRPSLYH